MVKRVIYFISLMLMPSFAVKSSFAELVAYYPMNEGTGTVIEDASSYQHDGLAAADPTWVDGPDGFGQALFFDGSNPAHRSRISCPRFLLFLFSADCARDGEDSNYGRIAGSCNHKSRRIPGCWDRPPSPGIPGPICRRPRSHSPPVEGVWPRMSRSPAGGAALRV